MSPFSVRRFRSLVPLSGPGGDERVRTDDPLLAKQVLSQLSYTPMQMKERTCRTPHLALKAFAGLQN